jgi:Ca2+-binding EF-hand superfamily protein
MAYMDKNGDGKVTLAEAPADVKTAFSFIDKNGDGGIDVMEAQVMVDFGNKTQSQSPQEAVTTDSRAEPVPTNDQP